MIAITGFVTSILTKAQIAFVECMRNLACSGAKALAVTDNLNFGNPNKPEAYYMLKEALKDWQMHVLILMFQSSEEM